MLENLALAFPEKSAEERREIAKGSLVHLGQVAMEIAVLPRHRFEIAQYVSLAPGGEEIVRGALARGRGLVFAAGHIGNWELLALRLALLVKPGAVVARHTSQPWLDRWMERFRASCGFDTFWREDRGTARGLLRLFRQGGGLGILIDQDTRVEGVYAPFFGKLAFTPRAAADLALRFEAALLVTTSHRRSTQPGQGHEVELTEIPYDPDPPDREAEVLRITRAAVALQEAAIRRYPTEWVWMHERWKTRPPEERPAGDLARSMPKSRELSGI